MEDGDGDNNVLSECSLLRHKVDNLFLEDSTTISTNKKDNFTELTLVQPKEVDSFKGNSLKVQSKTILDDKSESTLVQDDVVLDVDNGLKNSKLDSNLVQDKICVKKGVIGLIDGGIEG